MVVTRSQSGEDSSKKETRAPSVTQPQREEEIVRPPVLEAFLSAASATDGASTSAAPAASTHLSTAASTDTRRPSTVRPVKARSVRSAASRKRLLAELEAKERLAELKIQKVQAEQEVQRLKLQRLRLEEEETEESGEEIEDELESVRIEEWMKRTPLKDKEDARATPPPEGYEQGAAEGQQRQGNTMEDDKKEEEAKDKGKNSCTPQPVVDVASLAATLLHAARSTREPPKYIQELPFFNGNSQEYLGFRAAYESSSGYFSRTENLARIRRSLKGTAKEAVGCLLLGQPDPQTIMEALERRFGRPEALIHAETEKLKALHKVSDNPRDLCIFAGSVANVIGTVEALKKPQYLYNPELARIIIEKLTPILKSKWYDYAAKKKEETPEIKKISEFLNEEADKCGAYALPEIIEDTRHRERRFHRGHTYTTVEQGTYRRCPMCKSEHMLPECTMFRKASVRERWKIAKENGICYRCLKSKHQMFLCEAPCCGKQGCNKKHHKYLHYDYEHGESRPSTQPEHSETTSTLREVTNTPRVHAVRHVEFCGAIQHVAKRENRPAQIEKKEQRSQGHTTLAAYESSALKQEKGNETPARSTEPIYRRECGTQTDICTLPEGRRVQRAKRRRRRRTKKNEDRKVHSEQREKPITPALADTIPTPRAYVSELAFNAVVRNPRAPRPARPADENSTETSTTKKHEGTKPGGMQYANSNGGYARPVMSTARAPNMEERKRHRNRRKKNVTRYERRDEHTLRATNEARYRCAPIVAPVSRRSIPPPAARAPTHARPQPQTARAPIRNVVSSCKNENTSANKNTRRRRRNRLKKKEMSTLRCATDARETSAPAPPRRATQLACTC